ncbi:hypothetical protein CEY16_01580 [Halalkalibacillus sediminis]|uniref:Uncharacterized protein n=1 Tax=Halalkalibacillus sediminis TaxID=2018042 RepID=A0A2I0QVW2_9BACI|nr:DUF6612 family protein [Halalkalibacillus sediminis]PKR78475.1 hypothetical protein CEY16_01580 [Halalkalibacillus sediminis]
MKKILLIFILLLVSILIACQEETISTEDEVDATTSEESGEEDGETSSGAEEENEEDDQGEEENEGEDQSEEVEDEDSSDDSNSDSGKNVLGDTDSILEKTAKAMEEVTSFKGVSEYYDDSTSNGVNEVSETLFTMEIVLSDPAKMHAEGESIMDSGEESMFEMYMAEGDLYIFADGNWFTMPTTSEYGSMYEQYKVFEEEQIDEYLKFSKHFSVTDQGDHYLLSFEGDHEDYKNVIMGASFGAQNETLKEHYENMQISNGSYEIKVDKDTFYMTEYSIEYEAETTGEIGEVKQYHKGTYKLSDFNAIDEITVPEEVVDNAQSF